MSGCVLLRFLGSNDKDSFFKATQRHQVVSDAFFVVLMVLTDTVLN